MKNLLLILILSSVTLGVKAQSSMAHSTAKSQMTRWSIGVNAGIPFFWGDMVSMSADKSYISFGAGLQGSYRISNLFGVSLSADYAQGKSGARDYSKSYLLAPNGETYYTPTAGALPYDELYSKISTVTIGASFDVNLNGVFCYYAANDRFTVWVSPTIYGQFFDTNVYAKTDNVKFSDGTTKPRTISLGLGGALSLRYRVSRNIELQLKNSLVWMTDNKFDGIVTPYGKTEHNAMWTPQLGIIWNIK